MELYQTQISEVHQTPAGHGKSIWACRECFGHSISKKNGEKRWCFEQVIQGICFLCRLKWKTSNPWLHFAWTYWLTIWLTLLTIGQTSYYWLTDFIDVFDLTYYLTDWMTIDLTYYWLIEWLIIDLLNDYLLTEWLSIDLLNDYLLTEWLYLLTEWMTICWLIEWLLTWLYWLYWLDYIDYYWLDLFIDLLNDGWMTIYWLNEWLYLLTEWKTIIDFIDLTYLLTYWMTND